MTCTYLPRWLQCGYAVLPRHLVVTHLPFLRWPRAGRRVPGHSSRDRRRPHHLPPRLYVMRDLLRIYARLGVAYLYTSAAFVFLAYGLGVRAGYTLS